MSIKSVMPSNHLILCHPLLLLLSVFPTSGSFLVSQFQHQSFQWIFRIGFLCDWLNLLAVQVILKSLLQYHSSKGSILCHSTLFILQLSYPYMTTGKTIALTRWTFVGKVMSLLFNMLSRLDDNKLGKFWKRWEYQTTWPASWGIYMQVRKQQLELNMEQQIGSK